MPGIRSTLWLIALPLAVICAPARAQAASTGPEPVYPAKPVRLLVGFTRAGASTSTRACSRRSFPSSSASRWSSRIVPGRARISPTNTWRSRSRTATRCCSTARPSRSTCSLYSKPPYDALRDFAGVSVFSESSAGELLARTRRRRGIVERSGARAREREQLLSDFAASERRHHQEVVLSENTDTPAKSRSAS